MARPSYVRALPPRPGRLRLRAAGVIAPVLATITVLFAGCSGSSKAAAPPPSTTSSASLTTAPPATTSIPPPTTVAPPTTAAAPTTPPGPPPFSASVEPVTAADLGATWHAGCPVGPRRLRDIQLSYWGFDSTAHRGTIVVNEGVVSAVEQIFATLYRARFPIREMVPQAAYGGNDNAAAAADDTSGFNCRYAVAPGPPQWSVHAFGEAIDVNDVENPYLDGATVIPPAGGVYEDRADVRPGMAVPGGTLVDAFAAVGWQWGGRWTAGPDYQHFSATGG